MCDELPALRGTDDTDQALTETRVMNQFAQDIHDRLVRSDVKRYIAQHGMNSICSMDVLETASDAAKDHAVEEQYAHTYRESVEFLNKRVEEKGAKLRVANINSQQTQQRQWPQPTPQRTEKSAARESQNRGSRHFSEQRQMNNFNEKYGEHKKRFDGPVVCYRCQQTGHISQGCRNPRVQSEGKGDSRVEMVNEKKREDKKEPSNETKGADRHNQSVRQTRFQEVSYDVSGSSDDSSSESSNEARVNSIAIEVNGVTTREEQNEIDAGRVELIDPQTLEIALHIKINGRCIKAVLDTGSPVTVISQGVYERMDRGFEEGTKFVSSVIRKSKLKLFSCEKEQAVATSGECDVRLEHKDFQFSYTRCFFGLLFARVFLSISTNLISPPM